MRLLRVTRYFHCTTYESINYCVTSYFLYTSYELLFIPQVTSYFHCTSYENIVIETNEKNDRDNKQPNDTHDNNEAKSKQDERHNQFRWPSGTCAIVGDSMVNEIDEKRLSQKYDNVKVFHFSGARIEDLNHYIVPIIKNEPDYLILHVRTNGATKKLFQKTCGRFTVVKSKHRETTPKL